jgi:transposase InsO family protein
MTYGPTWSGFIYLAVVLDAWSRRGVSWAIGEQMNTDLVLDALNMALQQRRPEQIIHHGDQGSQYTSLAFGNRCRQMACGLPWEQSVMPLMVRLVLRAMKSEGLIESTGQGAAEDRDLVL